MLCCLQPIKLEYFPNLKNTVLLFVDGLQELLLFFWPDNSEDTIVGSIAKFMAYAHETVNSTSQQYKQNDRRWVFA